MFKEHKKAIKIAELALQEALEKIDDVEEETLHDAKSIIELLKENLLLWKENNKQQVDDEHSDHYDSDELFS